MSERPKVIAKSITVDLIHDDGDWSAVAGAEDLIAKAASAVAVYLPKPVTQASVSIALSSDRAVAALNAQYRNKPKATNVLSFPAGRGAAPGFLGDIIFGEETVVQEARDQGTPLAHHLQHLTVHGLLHLIGYEHETDADAHEMETLEIEILERLGVANPYTGDLDVAKKE